jgi:hypothetical protein
MLTVFASLLLVVIMSVLANIDSILPRQYVYGKLRIPAHDIYADVYIRDHDENCDCTTPLWHGGKVTVKADLSSVQLYDMATLTSLSGEYMVLECVSITGIPAWLQKTDGDVLVVNDRLVYRFIRL